ncbi:recombinase family protein [Streptomyces nodosus]|uniref:recombinase family protein n=1 Tax=Streptomyces nodosus TaxID=40318 RepID=UPI0038274F69
MTARHPAAGFGRPSAPGVDVRLGYGHCSHLSQELDSQLDALTAHGIAREKIFSKKISTRVRVRPQFEQALRTARKIKAHAPHCRMILTVYEMKRLGRDAAELTALADHLTAHALVLEMLTGPLPGIHDPTGPSRPLFAFFAAMAETERENIRESTLEVLDTAARKGKHGGRPPVVTDDMLHTVLRRRANGVRRADPAQPDHPHWQAQGTVPVRRQHLPGTRRARQARGVPRSRRSRARRLRRPPGR